MPTADNPDIRIEYGDINFPPSTWTELQDYAVSFKARDAGVLNVPSVNVFLHNFQGRFTDNQNSLYLKNYGIIRVRADVGNGLDTLFYGRIYGKRDPLSGAYFIGGFGAGFGAGFQVGTGGARSTVELFCKDIGAQSLLDETKTYPEGQGYASQKIKCKEAIEHFLANPDSGIDTGITLETDNGLITTTDFPRDPNKDSLLDLLRQVADAINYDGYIYINSSNQLKLYFKQACLEETYPAITLQRPFKSIEPNYDLDEIGNIIFVWGGTDLGVPVDGDYYFTEHHDAGTWTIPPSRGSNSITEFNTASGEVKVGTYSVKRGTAGQYPDMRCNIYNTPPGILDAALRFNEIRFWLAYDIGVYFMYVKLCDSSDNLIRIILQGDQVGGNPALRSECFQYKIPFGPKIVSGNWAYWTGSAWNDGLGNYDMTIKWFELDSLGYYGWAIIDGLYFYGGLEINPITYPTLNPKIQDLTGGTIPRPKVYHHEDDKINSFEQAQTIGQYVLAVKKNLLHKVTLTKGAYTWTKPHQFLRLYHPEHNIGYTEKHRILEQQQDWTAENKVLRTTFTLIKRPNIFDSKAIQMSELAGLLKKIGEG